MSDSEETQQGFSLEKTLEIPSRISSLAFGHAGHLFAGADDGSFRIYDLSAFKVLKGVRGLGAEVSSIVCVKKPGSDLRDAWIIHGKYISKFQMDSPKMIQTLEDAVATIQVSQDDNEILNELALNANKSHLAFTLDSGVVGVVDLSDKTITRMQTKHDSVCDTVKFVPDRPRELISGGYDTILLHFDYVQGKVLSRRQMDPYTEEGGVSLSPPFILSTAMSATGVLAAGTADGRLFVGFGGEKSSVKGSKKKSKKWEGLEEDETVLVKVAEGPIVAMAFADSRRLITSTLLGVITEYHIFYDQAEASVVIQQSWQQDSPGLTKVNALIADDKRIIVGGFSGKGRGVIEIWKQDTAAAKKDKELSRPPSP
ncbi:WD40-repeat-containing domain protein [Gymnopilus junonius]|uniref:WD40-repeat-containing domain protein n=1 Tax=Gymnopilus junonius TaxID=109634 RepID=A0A9P5P188_GYMJU|nr:WD40-repeat-containing domain protein [Gymnopilus junonius]